MRIERCCPIWCPLTDSIASKPGFEDRFQHFVTLAKATELYIVFDYAWLAKESLATFQRLVADSEQLFGYPVDRFYSRNFRREEAFSDDLLAPADATTEDEEPPPYIVTRHVQEDLVVDLNRIGDDTLNEFKERCEAEEEEAGDRLLQEIFTVYDRPSEKVDPLIKGQGESTTRKRGLLERKDELLKRKSTLLEGERNSPAQELALLDRESGLPKMEWERIESVTVNLERSKCEEQGMRARSAPP
ncbi:hypothetical protein GQ44DRAFT_773959 [Phaeosphaeriaceae sp. PMI808]|nr:hypothetical protein GQ44DRAFT_773959 [Phaeosphaeriaceae sp. PMI808]